MFFNTPKCFKKIMWWANSTNRNSINHKLRRSREKIAREKGDHTKEEWIEMLDFFNYTCCRCLGYSGCEYIQKDHIIPIYQGSSNSIRNIQPLCTKCNRRKGSENTDWRPMCAEYLKKKLPENYQNAY